MKTELFVVILNPEKKRPKYHSFEGQVGSYTNRTRCGSPWWRVESPHSGTFLGSRLRREHADLFADPCKQCYREDDRP